MLALSALHIAHLRPDSQSVYWQRAIVHQDQALHGQQVAMASVNQANADALFAFSFLIICLAFAMPGRREGAPDTPLHGVTSCLHMLSRARAIGPAVTPLVRGGPLSTLLNMQPGNIKNNPNFNDANTEAQFAKLLVFASANADMSQDYEGNDVESYAAAASSLRATFLKVEANPDGETTTNPIWQWAIRLPPSFLTRLAQVHSVPLILVAHWCVLLHDLHYWWIHGWVDNTMANLEACLLPEHRDWLQWPKQRLQDLRSKPG